MEMTREIAWAAATDAAVRQAKKNGRKRWSLADRNLAAETFERLWPEKKDLTRQLRNMLSAFP